jgi:hypothetical protein
MDQDTVETIARAAKAANRRDKLRAEAARLKGIADALDKLAEEDADVYFDLIAWLQSCHDWSRAEAIAQIEKARLPQNLLDIG